MPHEFPRRSFLQVLAGLLPASGNALGAAVRRVFPNQAEGRAVAEGRKLGIGSARIEGPRSVEVRSHQTWTLVYTAGPAGIRPGGGIRIALRHLQRQVGMPQTIAPRQANYLSAQADGKVPVKIDVPNGWKVSMTQYFAWQNIVQVTLPERGLSPGEMLRVTFGDRSGGGPGMEVQPYDETHYGLKCYVDAPGQGDYLPLENSPAIQVVAAGPHRLQVVMPSDAVAGQQTWCIVRAEDPYGNPAPRHRGTVQLTSTDPAAELPPAHKFAEHDRGVYRFEGIEFAAPGIQTVRARAVGDETGRFQQTANPVRVAKTRPPKLLLWGDLHGHTLFSDGRGTVQQYYDFAQRVAGLDFCAVSDHAFQILDEMWEYSKAVTNRLNQPGKFVTFNGYEWSGRTPDGGDHNVYFLQDDPPIYRSTLMYDRRNLQMHHANDKVGTVEELMAKLAQRLKYKDVLCIPHFGGRPGNPKWHDSRVQRLVEIYSDHRRSEEWANTFLTAGHRVGIMASTDNHYGNPGYGYLKILRDWDKQEIGTSAIAVYAAERTRESIFHAIYDRHTYATSGARIILSVEADGHSMGSEFKTDTAPIITIDAVGTAPVARVEIRKNSKLVHTETPGQHTVHVQWQDPQFQADHPSYYYARVVQDDNEEAICSPIWVN